MGDELDKALHECMGVIWKAYRDAVLTNNAAPFNECFDKLYKEYDDDTVCRFIEGMGMGLAPAINKRIRRWQ